MTKNYKLAFSPESKLDVAEAINWYNIKKQNLGERFKAKLKLAIKKIVYSPLNYQIKYGNIRIKTLDVFPYAIHYTIEEDSNLIIVLSVFHFSRNPYWM